MDFPQFFMNFPRFIMDFLGRFYRFSPDFLWISSIVLWISPDFVWIFPEFLCISPELLWIFPDFPVLPLMFRNFPIPLHGWRTDILVQRSFHYMQRTHIRHNRPVLHRNQSDWHTHMLHHTAKQTISLLLLTLLLLSQRFTMIVIIINITCF